MPSELQKARSTCAVAQGVELGLRIISEVNDQIDPDTQVDLGAVLAAEINNELNNRGSQDAQ
ncbi:hypothetical protein [Vibrio phage BONAISHI]|nr:hypothetical protein [Vibrio phage BONAISHI]